MPNFLSPICNDQTIDSAGDPLTGGQIETYIAGSTTAAATFTTSAGTVTNPNPIILNSLGYPPNAIWLKAGQPYKFVIKDADGATLKTIDNVSGINDAAVAVSEWVTSGLLPTFISATSFSVVGDQTGVLQVGRRIKTTNTSGVIYSGIVTATFGSGITTVVVLNDSGVLDSGLSAVEYGLISADNTSFPFATFSAASTIALSDDAVSTGDHYLTFADGTAGQEALKTNIGSLKYKPSTGELSGVMPIGTVIQFAASTAPAGFLKANGAAVSRTTYAALFAVVGTTFGVGDGSTTFNLPNLRGEFVRGWDDGRGVDTGRVFGSAQADELESHTHSYPGGSGSPNAGANTMAFSSGTPGAWVSNATGGTETRPRNIALLYCIKF